MSKVFLVGNEYYEGVEIKAAFSSREAAERAANTVWIGQDVIELELDPPTQPARDNYQHWISPDRIEGDRVVTLDNGEISGHECSENIIVASSPISKESAIHEAQILLSQRKVCFKARLWPDGRCHDTGEKVFRTIHESLSEWRVHGEQDRWFSHGYGETKEDAMNEAQKLISSGVPKFVAEKHHAAYIS